MSNNRNWNLSEREREGLYNCNFRLLFVTEEEIRVTNGPFNLKKTKNNERFGTKFKLGTGHLFSDFVFWHEFVAFSQAHSYPLLLLCSLVPRLVSSVALHLWHLKIYDSNYEIKLRSFLRPFDA